MEQRPLSPVLLIALILLGMSIVLGGIIWKAQQRPAFVSQTSTFLLEPPAGAIPVNLTTSTGTVEQFVRENTEYTQATPGGMIRQGESIATKLGNAIITLADSGNITLRNNSQISFIHLLPNSIVLWHRAGAIEYEVNSMNPFSIRTLHALVELWGDAVISTDDPIIKIQLNKGTAKVAIVDADNNTKIWNMTEGQLLRIDDDTREVELRN
jgi:hypothetical protein